MRLEGKAARPPADAA